MKQVKRSSSPAPEDTADIQSLFRSQRPQGEPKAEKLLVKLRPVFREDPNVLASRFIQKTMKREIVWEGEDRAWFRFGGSWTYLRCQWDEEKKYVYCFRQIWE